MSKIKSILLIVILVAGITTGLTGCAGNKKSASQQAFAGYDFSRPDGYRGLQDFNNVLKLTEPEDRALRDEVAKRRASGDDMENLLLQAMVAFRDGENEKCVGLLDRLSAMKAGDEWVFYNRGLVLNRLKRYDEAVESFKKALGIRKKFPEAYFSLSLAYSGKDDYKPALEAINQSLFYDNEVAEAHNNKGIILNRLGMSAEALASYKEALRLKPDYGEVYLNRGMELLFNQNKPGEAMADFEKAVRYMPGSAASWAGYGLGLAKTGKYEQALQCLDKALEIDPSQYPVWSNRGLVLKSLKRYDEAVESFNKALALGPGHVQAIIGLAGAQLMQGNTDAALANLKRGVDLMPDAKKIVASDPDWQKLLENKKYAARYKEIIGE